MIVVRRLLLARTACTGEAESVLAKAFVSRRADAERQRAHNDLESQPIRDDDADKDPG